ncbi:MAG: sulfite reductase, beta subunit (hemoprotein), partial [Bacillota bacterium]
MIKKPVFLVPESIKEDTRKFEEHVSSFVAGDLSAERLKGYRVPMGVYGQRGKQGAAEEKYMVRVRLPGGVVTPRQLKVLHDISREYGSSFIHFTTRQDAQIHQVDIEDTPEILYKLLEAGLSPRGGGGNTVRNIANSSRAGINPDEEFDTTPHALALSEYLLKFRSSFNLPRKYKIAFSSTSEDEALATINDLGFIAHNQKGQPGFKVYAAGGMGNSPEIGLLLKEFIPEQEIFQVAEAIKRLFADLGDRENKHQARLRFVRHKLGDEKFVTTFQKYFREVKDEDLAVEEIKYFQLERKELDRKAGDRDQVSRLARRDYVYPEKTAGYYAVDLTPEGGDLESRQIEQILSLVEDYNLEMRSTNRQGLLLRGIENKNLASVIEQIKQIDEDIVYRAPGLRPIACKGASTCRLGLCLSPNLAREIKNSLQELEPQARETIPQIYISGCPNSCGQHHIGKLGLEGKARRHQGRLVPFYSLLVGGRIEEDKSRYGDKLIDLPARRIPDFLARLARELAADPAYDRNKFYEYLADRGREKIKELARDFTDLPSYEEEPAIYKDWGQTEDFSLAGRGPGECGTGVMDIIKLDIDTANSNFAAGKENKNQDQVYKALIEAARALLIIRGIDTEKDRIIVREFKNKFVDGQLVDEIYGELLDQALDYRLGENVNLLAERDRINDFLDRIEELYNSLDANLEFQLAEEDQNEAAKGTNKSKDEKNEKDKQNDQHRKDLRGVKCPLNFVKAKLFIEPLPANTEVTFYLD